MVIAAKTAPNITRKPITNRTPEAIHWVQMTREKPSWLNHSTSVQVCDRNTTTAPRAKRMIRVHIRGPGRRPGSRSRRSGRAGREDPPEPDPAEPREARGGRMRPPLPKSAAGSKPKGLPRTGSSSSSSVRRRPARRRGSSDVPSSLSFRERAGPPGREESAWWNPPRTRSSRLASSFEAPGASSPSGLSLDSSSGLVLTITPCLGRRARRAELAARGAPNGPIVPQVAAGPKTRAAPPPSTTGSDDSHNTP